MYFVNCQDRIPYKITLWGVRGKFRGGGCLGARKGATNSEGRELSGGQKRGIKSRGLFRGQIRRNKLRGWGLSRGKIKGNKFLGAV